MVLAASALLLVIPPSAAMGTVARTPLDPAGPISVPSIVRAGPSATMAPSPGDRLIAPSNATLAPSLLPRNPASSPPPISALPVTPTLVPPDTVPTVMTFATDSTICCVEQNFSAPAGGPWDLIVLNYTGQAVGGVYDSSYRAYVDQVQVLFGTTPEYGIWFVAQDVTRYASLFTGTFNFTFLLGAATVGGYFETSVSLSFYPPAPGTVAPTEPNLILPLFHRVFVTPSTPDVFDTATVPTDVVNATLELWTYPFGPDEFWYSTAQAYRNLYVDVNGTPIVSLLPFPYIQTGGQDLFAWRPITAVFTASARPYEYDVTAALGMIEGTHNFSANVTGASSGSSWLIGGSLLLYTNASAGPATTLSYRFSAPPPRYTSGSTGDSATDAPSYAYSSAIPLNGTPENVSISTNESFSLSLARSSSGEWNNITGSESLSSHETSVWDGQTYSTVRSLVFPLAMDVGQSLVISSTTGGTYPEYGNFTSYFLNADQEWVESSVRTLETATGPQIVASSLVDDRCTGGDNVYAGAEELTGPTSALILSISFVASSTIIDYSAVQFGGRLATTFSHELIGASYQPPGPDNAETVLVNQVSSPLAASVSASTTVLDVGGSVQLDPIAGGGTAPYTFTYSGVPPGCTPTVDLAWSCAPTAAGIYEISAVARDASGDSVTLAPVTLVVNPLPTVAPTASRTAIDAGQSVVLLAGASGGTGALECGWTVNATATVAQSCSANFTLLGAAPGTYTVTVAASDALGALSGPVTLSLVVAAPPLLSVAPGSGGNATLGVALTFTATVAGGSGNTSFLWYVNGTVVPGVPGPVLVYDPSGAGTYTISVEAIDEVGGTAFEGPFTWTIHNATMPAPPAPSGSGSDLGGELLLVGLGAVLGAVVAVVAVRLLPPPRSRQRP
jgi:Peptide N-acetyl-beta-D-glucosaminyl asparaginase amidase A